MNDQANNISWGNFALTSNSQILSPCKLTVAFRSSAVALVSKVSISVVVKKIFNS